MKKDLTELVFILDKSGSMNGLESATIGGFNSLIEKQRQEKIEAFKTKWIPFEEKYFSTCKIDEKCDKSFSTSDSLYL